MVPRFVNFSAAWLAVELVLLALLSNAALIPFDDWAHSRLKLPTVNIHFRYAGSGPPLLLIHGNPQHSVSPPITTRPKKSTLTGSSVKLSWHTVGPILAQNYTVIAPDNRGMGASTIPTDYDYTAETTAEDFKAIMDYLNITQTYIFSHDKGVGLAAAFAAKYRDLVKRVGFSEYPLPGFGYEQFWAPNPSWDLYSNWQLAFFSVPDAATFFISGKEREMLSWYFWHSSYAGDEAISLDHLSRYADQLSKPGFLRSMLTIFSTQVVAADNDFFTAQFGNDPLTQPVLALAGEASGGAPATFEALFNPIAADLTTKTVPQAGHWILDENPLTTARFVADFLAEDEGIPSIDLSSLSDRFTVI
jgi:pimeloyl-ACP methyl ester carboxylesterase